MEDAIIVSNLPQEEFRLRKMTACELYDYCFKDFRGGKNSFALLKQFNLKIEEAMQCQMMLRYNEASADLISSVMAIMNYGIGKK